jgi:hypothetical protein
MILTDRFSYVHIPKTGGTFVTTKLFQTFVRQDFRTKAKKMLSSFSDDDYAPWPVEGKLYGGPYGSFQHIDKHAGACEFPTRKTVVATIRNPYSWYESLYNFRVWVKFEPKFRKHVEGFDDRYPHFPDLSFGEFLHLIDEWAGINSFGHYTRVFVRKCFPHPFVLEQRMDDEYWKGAYKDDLLIDEFLFTSTLSKSLFFFLMNHGIPSDLAKALPVRPTGSKRRAKPTWTPELRSFVRVRERVLFQVFPHFDSVRLPSVIMSPSEVAA